MSASKDKERGTWKIYLRYVDWQGVKQIHTKRGFTTKREALEYEREFLISKSRDLNMLFESFVEIYLSDLKPRIKYNTYLTKVHIIETKIISYFAKKSIAEIAALDILQWQNELLKRSDGEGKQYSQTYLRTIQNQLNAILNHANKYYGLTSNPAHKTTKMGKSKAPEMLFWTKEEYEKFAESVKSKPASYYAFEILYWCGIREGELLALTKDDFGLEKKTLTISKSFQRLKGKDYITSPKTEKSNRVIQLPQFLCDEMVAKLEHENPMNYGNVNAYRYKFKKFLTAVALGMKPATVWDGVDEATGGYIVVTKEGNVLAYHIYKRNYFEEYLLKNTKYETASTSRHGFGEIYSENGEDFINLNLQVRFR